MKWVLTEKREDMRPREIMLMPISGFTDGKDEWMHKAAIPDSGSTAHQGKSEFRHGHSRGLQVKEMPLDLECPNKCPCINDLVPNLRHYWRWWKH
jgi:hypothetical protein